MLGIAVSNAYRTWKHLALKAPFSVLGRVLIWEWPNPSGRGTFYLIRHARKRIECPCGVAHCELCRTAKSAHKFEEGRDHSILHSTPQLPRGITVVKRAFCAGRANNKSVRSVISTRYPLQNLKNSCIFSSFIGAVFFAHGLGGEAVAH